jgi:hypothetical protein
METADLEGAEAEGEECRSVRGEENDLRAMGNGTAARRM